jgi:hypothetical protein
VKSSKFHLVSARFGITAIREERGREFALRIATQEPTEAEQLAAKAWTENRRAFRPYDRGTGAFLGGAK